MKTLEQISSFVLAHLFRFTITSFVEKVTRLTDTSKRWSEMPYKSDKYGTIVKK